MVLVLVDLVLLLLKVGTERNTATPGPGPQSRWHWEETREAHEISESGELCRSAKAGQEVRIKDEKDSGRAGKNLLEDGRAYGDACVEDRRPFIL